MMDNSLMDILPQEGEGINHTISSEVNKPESNRHAVQYSVWSDCCNHCDFCLRKAKSNTSKDFKLHSLQRIIENVKTVDWANRFCYGISLLGGELFYIKDKDIQEKFMELVDVIIDYILIPVPTGKFSSVTNGLYTPEFLFRVCDRIVERTDASRLDINFSYDLKYRYKSPRFEELARTNINLFHDRYDYMVGIQMILTQYVINLWKEGKFDVIDFIEEKFKGNRLTFLYPHLVRTGKDLSDFYFKRSDFLEFMRYLKNRDPYGYTNFVYSIKNSSTFKYTGLRDKSIKTGENVQPILSDGKEIITDCGHSVLYRCYADSERCLYCDLKLLDAI